MKATVEIKIAEIPVPHVVEVPLDGKIKDRFAKMCTLIHELITKPATPPVTNLRSIGYYVISLGDEAAALFRAMDWQGMQVPEGVELVGAKGCFMGKPNYIVVKRDLPGDTVVVSPVSEGGLFQVAGQIMQLEVSQE